jgi:hypothetical protein
VDPVIWAYEDPAEAEEFVTPAGELQETIV